MVNEARFENEDFHIFIFLRFKKTGLYLQNNFNNYKKG